MAFGRLQTIRNLYRSVEIREFSYWIGSSRGYSNFDVKVPRVSYWSISTWSCKGHSSYPSIHRNTKLIRSTMTAELSISLKDRRSLSTQVKAPPQARQMGALNVSMLSPGIVYEPYAPREPISFWKRWFTRNGWRRTKNDVILELKSAYAISKLRKSGYSKQQFYKEALQLYKEINTLMALGDKTSLRKAVTEHMYSALKNEIKQRESRWSSVYWELIEPVVKIRTLRARLASISFYMIYITRIQLFLPFLLNIQDVCSVFQIGVDRNDLSKVFIQLTLEFLNKQKFEAYDSKGTVVAGNKAKEVLVRDIWVFEKSLFHPKAYWRLCGRISL
ncbi:hypothetical protein HHK36_026646 [Tetracentron sinense]|uniref:Large ribosomal subunit protein mL45 n=1 Tax=Tetracentron sinense TaxID=13715 RepID=A0A834YH73_TETSI|nr:hypothetical protein HHK36_026646 [Tetracentron sinense]